MMLQRLQSFFQSSVYFLSFHPLWRGRSRLVPWLRFLRLKAIFYLGVNEVWLPWINELVLPLRKGDTSLKGNYYVGLYEYRDMAFAAHLLEPGDLFVDIGANFGSYSLIASGLCGASSIAFEPVPTTYDRLRRVISANSLSGLVDARCCALASQEQVEDSGDGLWFSVDRGCCNSFVNSTYPGQKQRIAVSSLDHEISGLSPLLFKIDVEGFEYDVLIGGRNVLMSKSCMAVIIEGQTESVDQCLLSMGFMEVDYSPLRRKVSPPSGRKTNNKIWIKSDMLHEVEVRIKRAPVRQVYGRKF